MSDLLFVLVVVGFLDCVMKFFEIVFDEISEYNGKESGKFVIEEGVESVVF